MDLLVKMARMQGLLEMADVAYVGAGVAGSSVGMDKGIFKDVMRANHSRSWIRSCSARRY
jgi:D-alanine-D-alanine ligase-like ATP-grasp enzyme